MTLALAAIGATAGMASLLWRVYRDAIYRSRLRLRLSIIPRIPKDARTGENLLHFSDIVIMVTNRGREPVLVTQVGGRAKYRHRRERYNFAFDVPDMPQRFAPGDIETFVVPYPDNAEEITVIGVWDSLGIRHTASRGSWRHIQRDTTVTASDGVVCVTELGFRRLFNWRDRPLSVRAARDKDTIPVN